jgi:6-phosphogluconolactonase
LSVETDVLNEEPWARAAARKLSPELSAAGTVVITGGTTAASIYPHLAPGEDWSATIFFSDERCVPPDHPASNFGQAARTILTVAPPKRVERMRGEDEPRAEARRYHDVIAPAVRAEIDVVLLSLGGDGHIAALFPGSRALGSDQFCAAVSRPDGLEGLTLTPPALRAARRIFLVAAGEAKAAAVRRVLRGEESPEACPARLLVGHPGMTMLLDRPASSLL